MQPLYTIEADRSMYRITLQCEQMNKLGVICNQAWFYKTRWKPHCQTQLLRRVSFESESRVSIMRCIYLPKNVASACLLSSYPVEVNLRINAV